MHACRGVPPKHSPCARLGSTTRHARVFLLPVSSAPERLISKEAVGHLLATLVRMRGGQRKGDKRPGTASVGVR
jgi:hypothetical protein